MNKVIAAVMVCGALGFAGCNDGKTSPNSPPGKYLQHAFLQYFELPGTVKYRNLKLYRQGNPEGSPPAKGLYVLCGESNSMDSQHEGYQGWDWFALTTSEMSEMKPDSKFQLGLEMDVPGDRDEDSGRGKANKKDMLRQMNDSWCRNSPMIQPVLAYPLERTN